MVLELRYACAYDAGLGASIRPQSISISARVTSTGARRQLASVSTSQAALSLWKLQLKRRRRAQEFPVPVLMRLFGAQPAAARIRVGASLAAAMPDQLWAEDRIWARG
jgi:hypothetical protein